MVSHFAPHIHYQVYLHEVTVLQQVSQRHTIVINA